MTRKNIFFVFLIIPLFLNISCLHSKSAGSQTAAKKSIKVNSGSVILKIHGKIDGSLSADKSLPDGTITKDETINLSKGKKYTFSVMPAEVVTIRVLSLNGKDAQISVLGHGKEKTFPVKGIDKEGVFLAFQYIDGNIP